LVVRMRRPLLRKHGNDRTAPLRPRQCTIRFVDRTIDLDAPTTNRTWAGAPVIGGRYELVALVGRGGMGTVYRARDRELDEIVALKLLSRAVATTRTIERFRDEVRLARRVTHRNVVRTFDIGDDDGDRFITMEYVDGEPLSEMLSRDGRM